MAAEYMPSAEDFDTWDPVHENEAIEKVAKGFKVKYLIDADDAAFFALTPSGGVYRLPLGISVSDFDALMNLDDGDSVAALKGILDAFGGGDAKKLEAEPLATIADMLSAYGRVIAKVQGAGLGE